MEEEEEEERGGLHVFLPSSATLSPGRLGGEEGGEADGGERWKCET